MSTIVAICQIFDYDVNCEKNKKILEDDVKSEKIYQCCLYDRVENVDNNNSLF